MRLEWNITPDPELLGSLPQDYTLETALADILDNSLQAVWANSPGERRLISVTLSRDKITIFDSGQGMDSTTENSIAKWGTMGSSKHRCVRVSAIGGKPPFLTPYFGMYGFGGLVAAMHLGGVAVVSSKTKSSKKVVTLTLEKDKLMERCKTDRTWKTPGEYREPTAEEVRNSPHGSFTKVELSKLKRKVWKENQVMCMLKDIYFPYIQCDVADSSQKTTMPVEFEVNTTNLAEVQGGEVAVTNMCSSNGSPFVVDIHLKKNSNNMEDPQTANDLDRANARIACFYFPIQQGKETIENILEELDKMKIGINETFENFCRVSIRRLGRLLPDARWRRLPFMEPKRKRGDKANVPKICFDRVKAFVDTDAGFVPTTSKMDLSSGHAFTSTLRNLGTRGIMPDVVNLNLLRDKRLMTLQELEKEYEDWIKEMHDLFDEEVDCEDVEDAIIPMSLKELGFSQDVFRVYTRMNRKGNVWKRSMRLKFLRGIPGQMKNKDFYATLEYILADGFSDDRGNTKVICRPMEVPKEEGSTLTFKDNSAEFNLGKSMVISIDFLTMDKCIILNEQDWNRVSENKWLHSPGRIDILEKQIIQSLGLDGGLEQAVKAGTKPFDEIFAVVRPNNYVKLTKDGKDLNPIDQKSIVRKPMHIKLDLKLFKSSNLAVAEDTCLEQSRDISMLASEKSINGIHGFYSFRIDSGYFENFYTKAGNYVFTFSLMDDDGNPDGILKKMLEVIVLPSDKVGRWVLQNADSAQNHTAFLTTRLGSEIGPLSLHCFDEYGNAKDFSETEDLRFEVWSDDRQLDIELSVEGVSKEERSRTSLTIKAIKLTGGLLRGIAVDYSALLKLTIRNTPAASMGLNILPGEMDFIQEVKSQEVDNCLRTGDVIHVFTLQAIDQYGNHVEKGRKIVLQLNGLELQDSQEHDRMVDDKGCIKLGGLLKVTGPFNSRAEICVYSENKKLLYERRFFLLRRALQIVSEVPKECACGRVLQDIKVQIVDGNGNVDKKMTGTHHLIMLSWATQKAYALEEGTCSISTIQLPDKPGLWRCRIYHIMNQELEAQLEINLVPAFEPPMDVFYPTDDDATENSTPLMIHDRAGLQNDLKKVGEGLILRLEDLQRQMKKSVTKITKANEELDSLRSRKDTEMRTILQLQGEVETLQTQAQKIDNGDLHDANRNEFTPERIAQEISKSNNPAKFLLEALSPGMFLSSEIGDPGAEDILGIVSLLASVKSERLSKALAEFIGEGNMLAVVCKTSRASGLIVRYNEMDGKIDASWGLYKFILSQNNSVSGRLRVYILEEMRIYDQGQDRNHPQEVLKMEGPKLRNGVAPEGFMGYAVNFLHLNNEHLGLRASLFYNLFKELQVYETRKQLYNARDVLTCGGISLDGGLIRERGSEDFGKREEPKIMFPLYSKFHKKIPSVRSINHIYQSMKVKDAIKQRNQEIEKRSTIQRELEERINFVRKKVRSSEEKFENAKELLESQRRELAQLKERLKGLEV